MNDKNNGVEKIIMEEFKISRNEFDLLKFKDSPISIVKIALDKLKKKEFLKLLDKFYFVEEKKEKAKGTANFDKYEQITLEKIVLSEVKSSRSFTNKQLRKLFLKRLKVYENVGASHKKEFWLLASDSYYLMERNPDYFQTISRNTDVNHFNRIIELDLKRTITEGTIEDSEELIDNCRLLLRSYSKRNGDVGYCQGLNFIALEICKRDFSNEEAFWFFASLLENTIPLDYYSSMEGVLVDQKILNDLIEIILPEVSNKLKFLNIDCSIFSIQWFVCLFSRNLDRRIFEIFIDNLVVEGSIVLFKTSIVILKFLEKKILAAKDFSCVLKLLEERTRLIDDSLKFQESLNELYISEKIINLCRILYRERVYEENQNNLKRLKKIKSTKRIRNSIVCDQSFFICIKYIEEKRLQKRTDPFLLFRPKNELQNYLIKDYFSDINNREATNEVEDNSFIKLPNIQQINSNNQLELEDKFLICRHHHICLENPKDDLINNLINSQLNEEKNISEQDEASSKLMELINKACKESTSNKIFRSYSFEKSLQKNKIANRNSYSPNKVANNEIMNDAKGFKRSQTVFESNSNFLSENLGKSNFLHCKVDKSISEFETDINGREENGS